MVIRSASIISKIETGWTTNFNRTLADALANESILDIQGITEAVSRYYTSNGDSFRVLFVAPEYQARFERLANDARDYFEN